MDNCDKVSPLDGKGQFFLIATLREKDMDILSKTFLKVLFMPWTPLILEPL